MTVYVPAGSAETRWVAGDTYTFTATAATTGGSLALIEASVPPGSGPPPHVHTNEDEAFYLLSGRLEISADEETFTAGPGDFVFVPRGTTHRFTNLGVEAARALILLTPGGFERFFLDIGMPARAGEQPPSLVAEELHRIVDLAPRYGARILLPPAGASPAAQPDPSTAGTDARQVFAAIDSLDLDAIVGHLTDDARVVFGNQEPMVGRDAVNAGLRAFYSTIAGLRHRVLREWRVGSQTAAETEVTYQRLDGKQVSVPAVSIWHARDDGLLDDFRVFIDLAPVYSP